MQFLKRNQYIVFKATDKEGAWVIMDKKYYREKIVKNTQREKAPSNKTPAFTKSKNMDIWIVGTSNQSFIYF